MKHARNPRKYKKAQPVIMNTPSFNNTQSIWATERECLKCGYFRPAFFFTGDNCDLCQAVEKGADRDKLSLFNNNTPES